uniref:2Fe-2S ferredoxin-type domain-containing protein n=1 Tax=Chaetoceros debilis TaxID=122233 RepID=A0A7S3PX20_9STRA|mmetsp:Transcript_18769/g.28525  ORF Transcript_18769/g.28525 Transcript_18769/m.28525 type:complete len:112 (+) Transcript_18769:100-435(+)
MSRIFTILCLFVVALATASAFTVSNSNSVRAPTELQMTVLARGAKKMNFKPGSPLKNACAKLGVKPKYSCKKGDCGSCTVSVGGSRMKACVGKVPPEPRLKSLQEKGLEIK